MKCKYCQTELEEGVTHCPACGKAQETAEETPVAEMEEASAVEVEETAVTEETPAEEAEKPAAAEIKEGIKATPGKIAVMVTAIVLVIFFTLRKTRLGRSFYAMVKICLMCLVHI